MLGIWSGIKCSYVKLYISSMIIAGGIEPLVVKFADGGPKKRQQTQQNHGKV